MKVIISCTGFNIEENKENLPDIYPPLQRLCNGETVFERQLRILSEYGITQFVIAGGQYKSQLKILTNKKPFNKLDFSWTNDPVFYRNSELFSLSIKDNVIDDDTIILSGGLVFNRGYISSFIKDKKTSAIAVKEISENKENKLIVKAPNCYIETLSPDEIDDNCYMALPLIRFIENCNEIQDIMVDICEDGFAEEICCSKDLEEVNRELGRIDLEEQTVLSNAGSILRVVKILAANEAVKPMIISDSWDKAFFIKSYLGYVLDTYVLFDIKRGTPDYENILKGVRMFADEGCDFLISVGGDGAVDTAKLIRLFSKLDNTDDYLKTDVQLTDIKHIDISNGTGNFSAAIPCAKFIKDGKRQSAAYLSMLPDYVILEQMFFNDMNIEDKKSIALDALCRCVDVLFAVNCDERNKNLAQIALKNILIDLSTLTDGDTKTTERMLNAWFMSAKASYISGHTIAYSFGCKLAEFYDLPRGYGVALCSAFFWDYYAQNIKSCRVELGRKKTASNLNLIKATFGVQTNYELKELFLFLVNNKLEVSLPQPLNKKNILEEVFEANVIENTPIYIGKKEIANIFNKIMTYENICHEHTIPDSAPVHNTWRAFLALWTDCRLKVTEAKIKKIEFKILDETVDLCEQNGLQYFLSYGTLLGAVRGWKKNVWYGTLSISMPRKDWEKFIEISKDKLAKDYYIHNSDNDEHCWFNCIRVCKKDTYIEKPIDRFFYSHKRGIFINICPMDSLKKNKGIILKYRHKMCRVLDAIMQKRLNTNSRRLRFKGRFIMHLARIFSIPMLHKMRNKIRSGNDNGSFAVLGNRYSVGNEVILKEKIFPFIKMEFEGKQYNVPKDYHAVLKKLYGDYESITPPKMGRKPIRVSFGSTENMITFINKSMANLTSPKNKSMLKMVIVKLKKIFLRQRKFIARTRTRIAGAFRTKGLYINKNSRILASYKNKYKGQRCFLIGNGPSLKAEDLDLIENEISFACNLIFNIFEQTSWRPTYYCVSDSGIVRTNSNKLIDNIQDSTLMIREFAYRYLHIKPWDAVQLPYISVDWYKVRGNVLAYHYISHATVMSMMIELACYMGFKEIYIIGTDGTSASAKGSHFVDNYYTKEMKIFSEKIKKRVLKDYNPAVRAAYLQKRSLDIFEQLRVYAEKNDIKIFNATRGGVIEVFERADFDSIVANKG